MHADENILTVASPPAALLFPTLRGCGAVYVYAYNCTSPRLQVLSLQAAVDHLRQELHQARTVHAAERAALVKVGIQTRLPSSRCLF